MRSLKDIIKEDNFKIGYEVGYHARYGIIKKIYKSGYDVYFEDINETIYIEDDELIEQNIT